MYIERVNNKSYLTPEQTHISQTVSKVAHCIRLALALRPKRSTSNKDLFIAISRLRENGMCVVLTHRERRRRENKLSPTPSASEGERDSRRAGEIAARKRTRPVLSQFQILKIRRLANFMHFRNIVRRIVKLQNCERVGQEL